MAMKVGEGKFSLKSGFDKYLRLDKAARMVGVSDAVGAMEMFDPVWEDGKMAVLGEDFFKWFYSLKLKKKNEKKID